MAETMRLREKTRASRESSRLLEPAQMTIKKEREEVQKHLVIQHKVIKDILVVEVMDPLTP